MPSQRRIGPETYSKIEAAWPDILSAIADGAEIKVELARHGISRDSIRVYRASNPQADREWQVAREHSADHYIGVLLDVANDRTLDPAHARVKADVYKWLVSKYNPRLYGDRTSHDITVKTIDLTRIISDANARLAASRAVGKVIEGEVVRARLPEELL
jgi:hypothetical protein